MRMFLKQLQEVVLGLRVGVDRLASRKDAAEIVPGVAGRLAQIAGECELGRFSFRGFNSEAKVRRSSSDIAEILLREAPLHDRSRESVVRARVVGAPRQQRFEIRHCSIERLDRGTELVVGFRADGLKLQSGSLALLPLKRQENSLLDVEVSGIVAGL